MVQMSASSAAFSSPTGSGYRPFPARQGQNPFAMAGGALANSPPGLTGSIPPGPPAINSQAVSTLAGVVGRGFAPQAMVQFATVPASPLPAGTANPFLQLRARGPDYRDAAGPRPLVVPQKADSLHDAGWLSSVLATIARLGRVVAQVATGQAPTPDNPKVPLPVTSRVPEPDRSTLHKNHPWERPVFLGYRDGRSLYGAGKLFILG
jgi:hypothetical protein